MELTLNVDAKSSCNEVTRMEGCEYNNKVKVTAVPEHGKVNQQIIKLPAKYFKVNRNSVIIVSGTNHNLKTINIDA